MLNCQFAWVKKSGARRRTANEGIEKCALIILLQIRSLADDAAIPATTGLVDQSAEIADRVFSPMKNNFFARTGCCC